MSNIRIVEGSKKQFVVMLATKDGERLDLTPFDSYMVCLKTSSTDLQITETANANGSIVALSGSADKGELLVTIDPTDTATLKVGNNQDISVEVSASGDDSITERYVIERVLNVVSFNC